MKVKVRCFNIGWNLDEEDFDEEITEEEIEEVIKELPSEYETEVEIDKNFEEEIREQAERDNIPFEEEIKEYLSVLLTDKVSDDWGYCHNGFNYEILGIEE